MQAAAAATFSGLLGGDAIDWNDWVTDDAEQSPEPQATDGAEVTDEREEEQR